MTPSCPSEDDSTDWSPLTCVSAIADEMWPGGVNYYSSDGQASRQREEVRRGVGARRLNLRVRRKPWARNVATTTLPYNASPLNASQPSSKSVASESSRSSDSFPGPTVAGRPGLPSLRSSARPCARRARLSSSTAPALATSTLPRCRCRMTPPRRSRSYVGAVSNS